MNTDSRIADLERQLAELKGGPPSSTSHYAETRRRQFEVRLAVVDKKLKPMCEWRDFLVSTRADMVTALAEAKARRATAADRWAEQSIDREIADFEDTIRTIDTGDFQGATGHLHGLALKAGLDITHRAGLARTLRHIDAFQKDRAVVEEEMRTFK